MHRSNEQRNLLTQFQNANSPFGNIHFAHEENAFSASAESIRNIQPRQLDINI
jgi:hypothetical protein